MAITTYSELQAAIANWIDRSDMTARIPEFIDLAESDLRTDLYDSQMETRAYATTSTTSAYLELPSDYRGIRRMQIVYSGIEYLIRERTPGEMPLMDDGGTGIPVYFSVIGDKFQFWPAPDAEYRVEITYYKDVPALTDTVTTNWLLTDFPNLYLYSSLRHAAVYLHDDVQKARYDGLYKEAFSGVLRQNQKRKYGGHPLTIKAL